MTDFILNRNPDGIDVLHTSPSREVCNGDQIDGRKVVDLETARALVVIGQARVCHHCDDGSLSETATAAGPTYTAERPTLDVQNHVGDD